MRWHISRADPRPWSAREPRCWAERFSQAFFFSIQTFATIGYGQIAPNGMAANGVVTVEALVGLMYQALATGLLFARFTRPTAALLFSSRAVIGPYSDGQGLMFRIVNQRRTEIIELQAQVLFSAMEPDDRGGTVRRYWPLSLERNKVTFFPLSWTIVHPIDSASPLAGRTPEDLAHPGRDPGSALGHRRGPGADGPRALVVSRGRDCLERAIPDDVPAV